MAHINRVSRIPWVTHPNLLGCRETAEPQQQHQQQQPWTKSPMVQGQFDDDDDDDDGKDAANILDDGDFVDAPRVTRSQQRRMEILLLAAEHAGESSYRQPQPSLQDESTPPTTTTNAGPSPHKQSGVTMILGQEIPSSMKDWHWYSNDPDATASAEASAAAAGAVDDEDAMPTTPFCWNWDDTNEASDAETSSSSSSSSSTRSSTTHGSFGLYDETVVVIRDARILYTIHQKPPSPADLDLQDDDDDDDDEDASSTASTSTASFREEHETPKPTTTASGSRKTFADLWQELQSFHKEHGHTNVPQRKHGKQRGLGKWLGNQRWHYRKGSLASERAVLFRSLGVVGFDPIESDDNEEVEEEPCVTPKDKGQTTTKKRTKSRSSKKRKGRTSTTTTTKAEPASKKKKKQRVVKVTLAAAEKGRSRTTPIEVLDDESTAFTSPGSQSSVSWVEEEGRGSRTAIAATKKPKQKKATTTTPASNTTTTKHHKSKRNKPHTWFTWDERMEQLQAHRDLHGHNEVPTTKYNNPHKELGQWLAAQRSLYKYGKMKKERVMDLRRLGCSSFGGGGDKPKQTKAADRSPN